MRVTGGAWRSRRLRGPGRGSDLRPTPDALRERTFAVLGDRVVGARFLDLYAGSGAVGFEALSRGALQVVFVERHRSAAKLIQQNRESLEVPVDRARLELGPSIRLVRDLSRRGERFDLAWADPPFERWSEGLEALMAAFELGVIRDQGIACLECPDRAEIVELPRSIRVVRDLAGGASRVVLLAADS